MNKCLYEPINGSCPDCNGACKTGNKACPYYFIDPIAEVMKQWKKDADVDTPILWKYDYKRNKICLYTTKPGYFIGLHGNRYQKFHKLLKEAAPNDELVRNGIDIIEVDDGT